MAIVSAMCAAKQFPPMARSEMVEPSDRTIEGSADSGAERLFEAPAREAPAQEGRRVLRDRLRPPEGVFSHRWSASDLDARAMDVNEIVPLAAAWSATDPAVARDLLRSAFAAQADDGSLPRAFTVDGKALVEWAPWPTLGQAVLAIEQREANGVFRAEMFPRLLRYLEWALAYFDPKDRGTPHWRCAEESLAPETWDEGLYFADLTALLLAETDAVLRLGGDLEDIATIRRRAARLEEGLASFFWDAETRTFRCRYADGHFVARLTWSAILPLVWRSLPEGRAAAAAERLMPGGPLESSGGLALWERWPEDPGPPPVPAAHQALLVVGLELAGRGGLAREIRRRLAAACAAAWASGGGCPADLSAPGGPPSVAGAALTVLVHEPLPSESQPPTAGRRRLAWLEERRLRVYGALATLLLLVILGVAVWWQQRRPPPGPSIEALVGLAQNHYRRGEFEQTAHMCRELVEAWGEATAPSVRFLYGNALFRSGLYEEAAEQYRRAAADPEIEPIARFNLAQTAVRLGQREQAIKELDELAEDFREYFPELAERARLSANFLRARMNVSQPPAP